jgi:UTP-glucose-1-phosphate uridylyltransferase
MKPSLVILAAGMGTRFAGMKQFEPVAPGGTLLLDYTMHDAMEAGFGRIVFVIRPETQQALSALLAAYAERDVEIDCAYQRLDDVPCVCDVPDGRVRPWGTGQAVWAARDAVDGPFAVVNADDFYGREAFEQLAAFLQRLSEPSGATYALVGYPLGETLSERGPVNRAVIRSTADGWLEEIVETRNIEKYGADARYADPGGGYTIIAADQPVSMNLWGFTPSVFELLRERFALFFQKTGRSQDAEFYLPSAIQGCLDEKQIRVKVLACKGSWCGLTHRADQAEVEALLRRLTDEGHYPRLPRRDR